MRIAPTANARGTESPFEPTEKSIRTYVTTVAAQERGIMSPARRPPPLERCLWGGRHLGLRLARARLGLLARHARSLVRTLRYLEEEVARQIGRNGNQLPLQTIEEFVQALAKDVLDGHRAEQGTHRVQLLGGSLAAPEHIAGFQLRQHGLDGADAEEHRARKAPVQEQEASHAGRRDAARVHPEIGMVARRRAQQRVPLARVGGGADIDRGRQQRVVLDVEQARRLVGALQVTADLVETPSLVAEERAFRDAGMGLAGLLDLAEQVRQQPGAERDFREAGHAGVELVQLHPHLGRDQRSQGTGVLARPLDRTDDRGRVFRIRDIECEDAFGRGFLVLGEEALLVRIELDDWQPVVLAGAIPREGFVYIEYAGEILGALDI